MIGFVEDDGGRAAAGYRGHTGDCVTRAVAIATGLPYQTVYDRVNAVAKGERRGDPRNRSHARSGVYKATIHRLLAGLGWVWHPTMFIGSGCTVHLRADELPSGRIICNLAGHITAVIDGVIHDTHDPSRNGSRCVYGYWTAPHELQDDLERCVFCDEMRAPHEFEDGLRCAYCALEQDK